MYVFKNIFMRIKMMMNDDVRNGEENFFSM